MLLYHSPLFIRKIINDIVQFLLHHFPITLFNCILFQILIRRNKISQDNLIIILTDNRIKTAHIRFICAFSYIHEFFFTYTKKSPTSQLRRLTATFLFILPDKSLVSHNSLVYS